MSHLTHSLRLGAGALALVVAGLNSASCTVNTGADGDPVTLTQTATATEYRSEERYLTETVSVAETTLTETETRWLLGDPQATELVNQHFFGPYPDDDVCKDYAEAECEQREDGWYLTFPEDQPTPAQDREQDRTREPEPAEPTESDPAPPAD